MDFDFGKIKKLPKYPVEETWQLEIGMLGKKLFKPDKDGRFKSGIVWVTDSYGVMVIHWNIILAHYPMVVIMFVKNNILRTQMFGIVQQQITFGMKNYFECVCGRKCLKLFSRPEYYGFGCRHCQDLFYQLSRIHKSDSLGSWLYFLNRKMKIGLMKSRVHRIIYRERRTRRVESVIRAIQKWKLPESMVADLKTKIVSQNI